MKHFTKGQMAVLATYEDKMDVAIKGHYARAMKSIDVAILQDVHNNYTGGNRTFNSNCQACVLELLTDLGRIYFAQRDEEKMAELAKSEEAAEKGTEDLKAAPGSRSLRMAKTKGGKK